MTVKAKMKVEVWSDIMCPFCYIGKRNYERALEQFENKENVEIVWKSFQLDPSIPDPANYEGNVFQYLADRKGWGYEQSVRMHDQVTATAAAAGLDYKFEKAVVANSFKAHRLIQLAKSKGLGDEAEELLFKAYFTEGRDVADQAVLVEVGASLGIGEAEVTEALGSEKFAQLVRADIAEARSLGVSGVPFFVFDRKYAVSGAQPSELFGQTLGKAYSEWKQSGALLEVAGNEGPSCSPDGECS